MFLVYLLLAITLIVYCLFNLFSSRKTWSVKLFRKTGWAWPLLFSGGVSGGTTPVGPNTEIDASNRLSNLEAINFSGGISTNPALSQSGLALTDVVYTANGAVALPSKSGAAVLSGGTVLAMTLALPQAGAPTVGGDDGKILVLFNNTAAKNHTVTTPASGVQGSLHIITMSATASTFSAIVLIAYNGSWWVLSNLNCTLT